MSVLNKLSVNIEELELDDDFMMMMKKMKKILF